MDYEQLQADIPDVQEVDEGMVVQQGHADVFEGSEMQHILSQQKHQEDLMNEDENFLADLEIITH